MSGGDYFQEYWHVRCPTCGKILGNLQDKFNELIQSMTPKEALDALGLKRDCCRINALNPIVVVPRTTVALKSQQGNTAIPDFEDQFSQLFISRDPALGKATYRVQSSRPDQPYILPYEAEKKDEEDVVFDI